MRLLLDTHVAIWYGDTPNRVPKSTLQLINGPANTVSVSIASAWETSIKAGLTKLELSAPTSYLFEQLAQLYSFQILPISLQHVGIVQTLPLHHRDPFDRMLIAQAIVENTALISADTTLDVYGIRRIW